jgi:hypothetical protein
MERTGTLAFGFFTRGDLDDPSMPTFVSSGNAADFCLQVLKMPALDILRQFERWVLDNNRGELRISQCRRKILIFI